MEVKERNTIIVLISFIVGVFLLIYPVTPMLIVIFFTSNPIHYFTWSLGYLCLDLLILPIALFLYAYFLINPVKTLRGKKNIALGAMIFGSILVLFPVIAFSLDTFLIYFGYGEIFYWFYFGPILSLVLFLPGVALFIHGWFLKKLITSEEKRKIIDVKIKERNTIITIISFVAGVFLLIFILPMFLVMILVPNYSSYVFSRLYGYLYIDFLILAIPLFLYAYFLVRPMKTLRGKKILALGAMIFGGILIFFLIVAICFELNYRFFYGYGFEVIDTLNIILCIVILLPAITLIIHRWLLIKSIISEEKRKLKDMGIREMKIIIVIISLIFGVYMLILAIPNLIFMVSYNVLLTFTSSYGYLYLDLIILAITLFLYTYFLVRPMKTLRGKNIIALGAMIFGGILFLFPVISVSFDIYFYGLIYFLMGFSLEIIFNIILYLVLFLSGVALFIHGWFLKRPKASEER